MDEEKKDYRITKIEKYNDEKKQYNKKIGNSFGIASLALGVAVLGWNGLMEYMNVAPTPEPGYLLFTTSGMFLSGTTVSIVAVRNMLSKMIEKTKLNGRIDQLNLEIKGEEKDKIGLEDISRGGR